MSLRALLHAISLRSNLTVCFFTTVFLLNLSCKKTGGFFDTPQKFLETKNFPSYFLKIPYYGVNGKNGLENLPGKTLIDIKGIYVKGRSVSFLRTFNDSGLYYVLLEESLPYNSEVSLLEVKGKVTKNREPSLTEIDVKSVKEVGKVKEIIEDQYPYLIGKIRDVIHNPKSKLDLGSIKTWHLASSDDNILVFGRTYDLMYEFDIGILLEKRGDTYTLKKIYARELFKGE